MGPHKLYIVEASNHASTALSNHLGNVLTLFTDKKIPVGTGTTVSYYKADLVSSMDYSPFGAPLKGRTFNGSGSRYGFNGHEKNNELEGAGNSYDMGDRWLDVRLGRTPKLDAKAAKYPHRSPYAFAANNPILYVDKDGKENTIYLYVTKTAQAELGVSKVDAIRRTTQQGFDDIMGANKVNVQIIYESNEGKINMNYLDKTDAVAHLGTVTEARKSFAENRPPYDINNFTGHIGATDGGNPETALQDFIALDAQNINLTQVEVNGTDVQVIAWTILHGAGHLKPNLGAETGHDIDKEGINLRKSGPQVHDELMISGNNKSGIKDYMKGKGNESMKEIYSKKFSGKKHQDNYKSNAKKSSAKF